MHTITIIQKCWLGLGKVVGIWPATSSSILVSREDGIVKIRHRSVCGSWIYVLYSELRVALSDLLHTI